MMFLVIFRIYFVYNTALDSDGGAWRKRCGHTSWYNEGVSQYRGARKEFPSIAVLVLESNYLKIYDGDDPNLPMWMVFNSNANSMCRAPHPSSVAMLNAKISSLEIIIIMQDLQLIF